MEIERPRISLIHEAVLAALGCTKIDYRSVKSMDDGAAQIAVFVENTLIRSEKIRAQYIASIFGDDPQRGAT